jgi:hypothetical protein
MAEQVQRRINQSNTKTYKKGKQIMSEYTPNQETRIPQGGVPAWIIQQAFRDSGNMRDF